MSSLPLFEDIQPAPDETVWDIFDKYTVWLDQVTGHQNALDRAQALADESDETHWIAPERVMTCIHPHGLPW
jgi:hypothetical protein